jgi:serine/threonine protein kinase
VFWASCTSRMPCACRPLCRRTGIPRAVSDYGACCSSGCSSVLLEAGALDVWSLGVTLATCTLGFFPFNIAHDRDPAFSAWSHAWEALRSTAPGGEMGKGDAADALSPDGSSPLDSPHHDRTSGVSGRLKVAPEALTEAAVQTLSHLLLRCCGPVAVRECASSPTLMDLLVRMLDPSPRTRLTMAQVAQHAWFTTPCAS